MQQTSGPVEFRLGTASLHVHSLKWRVSNICSWSTTTDFASKQCLGAGPVQVLQTCLKRYYKLGWSVTTNRLKGLLQTRLKGHYKLGWRVATTALKRYYRHAWRVTTNPVEVLLQSCLNYYYKLGWRDITSTLKGHYKHVEALLQTRLKGHYKHDWKCCYKTGVVEVLQVSLQAVFRAGFWYSWLVQLLQFSLQVSCWSTTDFASKQCLGPVLTTLWLVESYYKISFQAVFRAGLYFNWLVQVLQNLFEALLQIRLKRYYKLGWSVTTNRLKGLLQTRLKGHYRLGGSITTILFEGYYKLGWRVITNMLKGHYKHDWSVAVVHLQVAIVVLPQTWLKHCYKLKYYKFRFKQCLGPVFTTIHLFSYYNFRFKPCSLHSGVTIQN